MVSLRLVRSIILAFTCLILVSGCGFLTLLNTDLLDDSLSKPSVSWTTTTRSVNESVGTVTVTAQLTTILANEVTIDFTVGGTSTAGVDHNAVGSTLTIAAGSTTADYTFNVIDDADIESDKTIVFTISSVTGTSLGSASVQTLTLVNNDFPPALSISDAAVIEGLTATFTVSLDRTDLQNVTVAYTTSNGTAVSPTNYQSTSGTLTILAGASTATLTVTTVDDNIYNTALTYNVTLSSPTVATLADPIGLGTVNNSDTTPSISVSDSSGNEGSNVTFTIIQDTISGANTTVDYTTNNGTATAGTDYTSTTGTATILPGSTTATISVPIVSNGTDETTSDFDIVLSNPGNATIGTGTATGTIVDNTLIVDLTTGTLPPGLTFDRPSTATHFDQNGVLQNAISNVPRFDHDPKTHQPKGLLIESEATNSAVQSEKFDDAAWTPSQSAVSANHAGTTAPDGNQTAEALIEDTSNNSHGVSQGSIPYTPGSVVTASVFVKSKGRSEHVIRLRDTVTQNDSMGVHCNLNAISHASQTNGTGVVFGKGLQAMNSGWHRCWVTGVPSTTQSTLKLEVLLHNGTGTSYTGNGSSGIYLWGAQVEDNSVPTSYIKTLATAVTRPADKLKVDNFASWFTNASNWTTKTEFSRPVYEPNLVLNTPRIWDLNKDGTSGNDRIDFAYDTATRNLTANKVRGGVPETSKASTATIAADRIYSAAVTNTNNNFVVTVNGASSTSSGVSGSLPVVDTFSLGGVSHDSKKGLNGHLRKITHRPRALTNAQAQAITAVPTPKIQWSAASQSVSESDGTATIVVGLPYAIASNVTVPYTVSGTATGAGADYTLANGTLTIPTGSMYRDLVVPITNNTKYDTGRTVVITLGTPTNATLGTTNVHTLTLVDNDAQPSISISDTAVNEGQNATFTVSLSNASYQAITVDYATSSGTAAAGSNFTAASGTLTIAAGATTGTFTVPTTGDSQYNGALTYNVNLSSATNATLADSTAVGTINNTNTAPSITIANSSANEGSNLTFTLTQSAISGVNSTVNYATADGTAVSGTNYTSSTGTATILAGATTGTFVVPTTNDSVTTANLTLTVSLSSVANATLTGSTATGTIVNVAGGGGALAFSAPSLNPWLVTGESLTLTASGGTAPYTMNDAGSGYLNTSTFVYAAPLNVSPFTETLTVTDALSATATSTVAVRKFQGNDSHYSSLGNTHSFGRAVAVNSSGHLFAIGHGLNAAYQAYWYVRRSTNSGTSWSEVDKFVVAGLNTQPKRIKIDSTGVIYVIGISYISSNRHDYNGSDQLPAPAENWIVRKSTDNGTTWTTVDNYKLSAGKSSDPNDLFIDSSNNVYVVGRALDGSDATHWIVRKTSDGGTNWTTIDDDSPATTNINPRSVALDPSGSIFVTGTLGNYWIVKKSANGGSTWTTVDSYNLNTSYQAIPNHIAIDSSGIIYVAGEAYDGSMAGYFNNKPYRGQYLRKSTDAGTSWTTVNFFKETSSVQYHHMARHLSFAPDGSLYMLTASKNIDNGYESIQIMRSTNGGTSFSYQSGSTTLDSRVLTFDSSGALYLATGTYFSAYNPPNSWKVFKSTDSGANFSLLETFNTQAENEAYANAVAVAPSGALFAVGATTDVVANYKTYFWTVRKSVDNGATWTTVDKYTTSDGSAEATAVKVDSAGNIYVVGYANDNDSNDFWDDYWLVRKSIDGGSTWTTIDMYAYDADEESHALAIEIDASNNVYVAGYGEDPDWTGHWIVRKSTNGGSTWTVVQDYFRGMWDSGGIHSIIKDASGNLYVAGHGHDDDNNYEDHWIIRKSSDAGANWTTVDDYVHTIQSVTARSLAIGANGDIYAAGIGGYENTGQSLWIVRKSSNAGSTWTTVDDTRLGFYALEAVGVAVDSVGSIYVSGFGTTVSSTAEQWVVRKSRNGGTTWTTVDQNTSTRGTLNKGISFCGTNQICVVGQDYLSDISNGRWLVRMLSP